jgi:hypothetical protein
MEFELTPKSLKQRVALELQLDHILLMKNENLEVPLLPKYSFGLGCTWQNSSSVGKQCLLV